MQTATLKSNLPCTTHSRKPQRGKITHELNVALVSSHHRLKNEVCYTFIPLVSSHDGLKNEIYGTNSLFNKN